MGFSLRGLWEGADFWDKEENKQQDVVRTQRAQAPVAPVQTVRPQQASQPSYGSGFKGVTSKFRDAFDANTAQDYWKRNNQQLANLAQGKIDAPKLDQSYSQEQINMGNKRPMVNLGQQIIGNTARFINTGVAGGQEVADTARLLTADATNNNEAWKASNDRIQSRQQKQYQPNSGLLGAGTIFNNPQEFNSLGAGELTKRMATTTIGTAGEVLPVAKGFSVVGKTKPAIAKAVVQGGVASTMADAGQQYISTGKINPVQSGTAFVTGGALTVAPPVVARATTNLVKKTTPIVEKIDQKAFETPQTSAIRDTNKTLQRAWDTTSDVNSRKQISQQIARNNQELTSINQGGYAKVPSKPDPLDPLKQEARKYKSAEEFVKAQPKLYRGVEKTSELGGYDGRGTYLTSDKKMAGAFTGKNGKVLDLYVDRSKLKIKKSKAPINTDSVQGKPFYDFSDDLVERPQDFQQTIDNLKKDGIEAVESADGKQILVFDKNKINTKQQLTDLYTQSQPPKSPLESLKQEANPIVNPKTGETLSQSVKKLEGYGWAKKDIDAYKKRILGETKDPVNDPNVISNMNPSGGVLVDYAPQSRMKAKLADNITTIDKTMGGKPDDMITIYRGAPKSQKNIASGDFITTNKELAKSYTGDGNVIEMKARKSDVLDDLSEPLGEEYIYRPQSQPPKSTPKTDLPIETSGLTQMIKSNDAGDAGVLGTYIKSPKLQKIFNEVLDTQVMVVDKNFFPKIDGGEKLASYIPEKNLILIKGGSKQSADMINDSLLEEGLHALRNKRGRLDLSNKSTVGKADDISRYLKDGDELVAKKAKDQILNNIIYPELKARQSQSTPTVGKKPTLQDALEGRSTKIIDNKAVRPKENTPQMNQDNYQSNQLSELGFRTSPTKKNQKLSQGVSPNRAYQTDAVETLSPKDQLQKPNSKVGNTVNPSIRERGFIETIIDDPNTSLNIKENLSSLYSVRNTKQLQTKAANLVKTNPDLAMRVAREDTSDIGVATSSELIKKLQKDGNYEQAIDVATNVAESLTRAGQTAQAASIYGRLTPEGILRFTQKEINAYNKATKKNIKLSPQQAKSLTEKATKIQEMPDGRAKDIATKQMLREVYETMPATWVEKVSTFQTMAQLLNPKTLIRNLGGNTIFSVLDNSSQVLATGIDKAISGVKGTPRTTGIPSIKTQAKGLKRGFNEGYEEAVKGINLGPRTQFELNDVPVFRDGALGQAEKGLNLSLRATDRAAYTAAFDDTLHNLLKTNKVKTPTTEMIEMAHHQGLYRTFQDESNAAKIFVGLKKALNIAGFEQNGKRWGLGDLILKYPKTPGNLIARGIDYSPVGILKGMIDLTKIGQGAAKQQSAANSIARGITGTGSLIGTGYALAGLGLITEKPEENRDLRNLQKSAGLGGYQLNTSGLRRFLLSGFNTEEAKLKEGDKLVSYDWAQPAAIPLSMGASMGRGEGVKKGASEGLNALSEGVETLAEQPLVRGVQQFFGSNKGAVDTLSDTIQAAPASFVPTLSNQVRQLTDNTTRNTQDPVWAKEMYNKAINRVPGVAGQLPAQVDTLGNDKKNYQNDTNNPFNVFLNPAFVNKYQPNNVATTNLNLNRSTGETKQLPNTVSDKVKINGEDRALTGKEQGDYQRFVGQTNSKITESLTKNPRFNALPDSQKVNLLASMQTEINNAAKVNLFGDKPEKLSESVDSILTGNLDRAIELKLKTQEKTVEKKSGKKKTAKTKSTKKKSAKGGKKGSKGGKGKKGKKSYKMFAYGSPTSTTKSLRKIFEDAKLSKKTRIA